jgi:hypothetical protein
MARNVLKHAFCRVFDSKVLGAILIRLVPATETEESLVDLAATIEQNGRGDDGHESLRFPGGSVKSCKTPAQRTLDHCLAIIQSKPPPLQIPTPHSPSKTVPPGQAQDTWWLRQLQQFAGAFSIATGSEEPRRFTTCEGKVFRPLGEAKVADTATVYKIQMVAKSIARGTLACTKRSVQCTAVKPICLDTDNGTNDVRTMFDDCGVLVDRVDKFHCATIDAAEASQRRNA